MNGEALLIEIGCEEIPARMIPGAALDLSGRIEAILDRAGIEHGRASGGGGTRRLFVRVEQVAPAQPDRDELVIGPPAAAAFGPDGAPTRAAAGFANKQGIDPARLERVDTPKGEYAGFRRIVRGKSLAELLTEELPPSVEGMWFPKTMRWAEGRHRWVRPVHWVLALHGRTVLPLELFGVAAGRMSMGHRFLGPGMVTVDDPDHYAAALERACVVVDPAARRDWLTRELARAAERADGSLLADPALLEEVADLVEWPGVVAGGFEPAYLDLPRELLVTTLRHHQKCFSVQTRDGSLRPVFLAVANTDRDPKGHIRRGNEWVVGGRLDDARFFWLEDRKRPLAERGADLERVVFHARAGTYADKAQRLEAISRELARRLGWAEERIEHAGRAGRLAKNDLVTGTVGEFPELQGRIGGLLLRAESEPAAIWGAVYAHYQPAGPDEPIPPDDAGCLLALADKLDTVLALTGAGEIPTGSRDPFGLRRGSNGIFRILIERRWPLSLGALCELGTGESAGEAFLQGRLSSFLRDNGATANEVQAVFRAAVAPRGALELPVHDLVQRLEAIRTVREREDFAHLVDLTKRVDNILTKSADAFAASRDAASRGKFEEPSQAARELRQQVEAASRSIDELERSRRYTEIVDLLAGLVGPVDRFFADVLVVDPDDPRATVERGDLLSRLRELVTRCFDIRELAGQADRRT